MSTRTAEPNGIFTIGHSTHELERFVELLKQHRIGAVADVRSMPYSRWQPQFNRDKLSVALKADGIAYVFLGKELGAEEVTIRPATRMDVSNTGAWPGQHCFAQAFSAYWTEVNG